MNRIKEPPFIFSFFPEKFNFSDIKAAAAKDLFDKGRNKSACIAALRQAKFYPPRQAAAATAGSTDRALRQLHMFGARMKIMWEVQFVDPPTQYFYTLTKY